MGSRVRIHRLKTARGFLGSALFLVISFAGLASCRTSSSPDHTPTRTQQTQLVAFNLGRIWRIEEGYYDEPHWVGVWTRRGETSFFDATWKHCWMNETKQDVVEVQSANDGQVVVFRHGVQQYYRATYSAQHPNTLRGRADWYGPDLIWKAEIEY